MSIFVSQAWSAVLLVLAKASALLAVVAAKAWALTTLPSVRTGLLILAFMLACYLVLAFTAWVDGVHWRRRYLPRGRRRRVAHAGVHRRRRCWSVVEGSGYEVHHERRPVGAPARRRFRQCWGVTCVSCGSASRDRHDEVAHSPSAARATLAAREQGWTVTVGDVRCPACARYIETRRRELHARAAA